MSLGAGGCSNECCHSSLFFDSVRTFDALGHAASVSYIPNYFFPRSADVLVILTKSLCACKHLCGFWLVVWFKTETLRGEQIE